MGFRKPDTADKKSPNDSFAWAIEVTSDGKVVKKVSLTQEKSFIGRMEQNQIMLDHPAVSRSHAMIQREGENCVLIDQGSQNGTYVNGKSVLREIFKPGDLVTIGPFTLKLQKLDREPSPTKESAKNTAADLTVSKPGFKKK